MITKDDVLDVVRLLRWVTRPTLILFFGGSVNRIKALEILLPALEREGKLVSDWHRGEKVYSVAHKKKVKPVSMEHEIRCAETLIRLWRCRMQESEIVPERAFRGFGVVAEGALRYSQDRNTMLAIEFETQKDYKRVMKSKITRYRKYLPEMETKFKRNITVLFVIDIDRSRVRDLVKRISRSVNLNDSSGFNGSWERDVGSVADGDQSAFPEGDRFPLDPFFFIDYETFKNIPPGKALKEKKYFWHDGNEWRLTGND
jgi:hypothetical protein